MLAPQSMIQGCSPRGVKKEGKRSISRIIDSAARRLWQCSLKPRNRRVGIAGNGWAGVKAVNPNHLIAREFSRTA